MNRFEVRENKEEGGDEKRRREILDPLLLRTLVPMYLRESRRCVRGSARTLDP